MTGFPPGTSRDTRAWVGAVGPSSGISPLGGANGSPGGLGRGGSRLEIEVPAGAELPPISLSRNREGVAFFSGYLLNRGDLISELAADHGRDGLEAASDAALVWLAWRRWKQEGLSRLRGTFAAGVWAEADDRLLMIRDGAGLHPLFYAQRGDRLVFGWSPQAILRKEGMEVAFNRVVMAEHLVSRWIDPEETFWRDIRRVPAAHGLEFQRGHVRIFRHWDPIPVGKEIRWVTEDELEEFPRLLEESVGRTLRFGQAGILLSGGFDSVSVAAAAADWVQRNGGNLPRAYSLQFFGRHDNETPTQRAVAQQLGLGQQFLDLAAFRRQFGLVEPTVARCAGLASPPTDFLRPPYEELLRLAANQGCSVALTGEGGDEWLCVSPAYAADLMARGRFIELFRLTRTFLRFWRVPVFPALRSILWLQGLRRLMREKLRHHFPQAARRRRQRLLAHGVPSWLAPEAKLRHEVTERFLERWNNSPAPDGQYLADVRASLEQHLFDLCSEERFQRDVEAGIPTLHPYLDQDMTEFLMKVPPSLLLKGGKSKALVRANMERRFPELGFAKQRKVTAFESFLELYRTEVPPLWRQLKSLTVLGDLGVVDASQTQEAIDGWLSNVRLHSGARSWILCSTEAWARTQRQLAEPAQPQGAREFLLTGGPI